jgi:hypothetical protein
VAQARRVHVPLEQKDFRGLYDRGDTSAIPDQFFSETRNNKYQDGAVCTRDGSQLKVNIGNIRRAFMYKRLNETPRFIILDTSGNFFDSLAPSSPIASDPSYADFSMVNYANRAYISVHDRVKGIPDKKLLVYEGSGMARPAAGDPPASAPIVSTNGSSGSIELGWHLFAVSFVTTSGFITAPSQVTAYPAPGGHKADLVLPIGPPNTAGRLILTTKSIPMEGADAYNGNPLAYELFFISGGTVGDNTTTNVTVNFFDSDLLDSADYLLDNLTSIPAGLGVGVYSSRLGVWAANGEQFTLRLSEPGQPEVFSDTDGFITIDPSDAGSGIKNCFEYRKALVICTQNRAATTTDNNDSPSTWSVDWIDKSSGTECFGVATILDARGINTDRAWVATQAGLISFEGYFRRPELSWNIESIWDRINKKKFNLVQIVDDPTRHRMYISVPLDDAVAISHIIVGDYSTAFTVYQTIDEKAIKWDIWDFPSPPVTILGDRDDLSNDPIFYIGLSNNIYGMVEGLLDDFGNFIPSFWKSSYKTSRSGWVNHFGTAKLRVTGTGILYVTCYGTNDQVPLPQEHILLNPNADREPESKLNFINELCSIKFEGKNFGDRYKVTNLIVMARELWWHRAELDY